MGIYSHMDTMHTNMCTHTHTHTHTHTQHTHTHTHKHTPHTHIHIFTDFISHQIPPEFTISENQAIAILVPFGILSTTDRGIGNNTDVFYYNIGRQSSKRIQ